MWAGTVNLLFGVIAFTFFGADSHAAVSNVTSMKEVTVIGSAEEQKDLPGSGAYVSQEDIQSKNIDDINEALRQVPGVYLREEDGYGLFPNISIRGSAPGRSEKVTLMEDGILSAPAPYSAPSAYYSPTTGRMHGIEVLKGTSQVKYGPQTTGGVVNYISTPVPEEYSLYTKALYGTDNEIRIHSNIGDTVETDAGRFGYLIEEYYRETDGFKRIDETPDFKDADRTGFRNSEPMLKLFWEPKTDVYQRLEWKIGYTDMVADETYLGLSEADFDADPYRRYSATRFDQINTKQTRTYLQYMLEPWDEAMLTVTGYYNAFSRDWFKLDSCTSCSVSTLSQALMVPADLAILKGEAAGTFRVRHNRRKYEGYGIQNVLDWKSEIGETVHEFEVGVRFHSDHVRRKQRDETMTQDANGVITATTIGADGAAGNRWQETDAWAFFIQDKITWGNWTFLPGYRYESLDYHYKDFGSGANDETVTATGDSNPNVWAAGTGVTYDINDEWKLLGGVHRGFSVPGPRDNIRSDIQEETSLGFEFGGRYDNGNHLSGEAIFFYTDFSDLIVPDNVGGSGAGVTENVGDVDSLGIELLLEYDAGLANGWGFGNPYQFAFTWTNAELSGDSNSTDAESIFAGGQDGNKVPYIPEVQFTFGTGLDFKKWGIFADLIYVGDTFTTANNVEGQVNVQGVADARFGKTDHQFTVDMSAYYKLKENIKAVLTLQNIFDEEYVVSRHPHGPRPGRPFTALGGVEFKF